MGQLGVALERIIPRGMLRIGEAVVEVVNKHTSPTPTGLNILGAARQVLGGGFIDGGARLEDQIPPYEELGVLSKPPSGVR